MKRNGEKIFWGLFFVLGAVFILVGRLGYLQGVGVLTLLLAVLLAACFIKSLIHMEYTGIFFSLAFFAILFDEELGITALTPGPVLLAALFGSIGFHILFHGRRRRLCAYSKRDPFAGGDCKTVDVEDESRICYGTSFGSSIKYVNTDDFRQADLACSFGAMKVYFDNAIIQSGSATVNLHVSFAGMELYVPKEWQVVNHASATFGAVDEKNRSKTTGAPVLMLTGSVSFGGVEIIYI